MELPGVVEIGFDVSRQSAVRIVEPSFLFLRRSRFFLSNSSFFSADICAYRSLSLRLLRSLGSMSAGCVVDVLDPPPEMYMLGPSNEQMKHVSTALNIEHCTQCTAS